MTTDEILAAFDQEVASLHDRARALYAEHRYVDGSVLDAAAMRLQVLRRKLKNKLMPTEPEVTPSTK